MSAKTVLVCDICKVEADAFQAGGTIPDGWVPAAIRGSMIEHVCPKCHLLFQDWCASVAGGVNYKTFRDALTEISLALKMPGSPDLAHDVPKEVERRLGELAQVKDWHPAIDSAIAELHNVLNIREAKHACVCVDCTNEKNAIQQAIRLLEGEQPFKGFSTL